MIGPTLGAVTGTTLNLRVLASLEDDELQRVFDSLVSDAAVLIAEQLRRDSMR